jgi:TIGR03009 family protein
MEAILRRWEAVSEQNVTLCAKFKRTDSTKFGSVQKYEGEALFRKPNLACLEWKQVVQDKDGNDKRVFTERIVCGGDKVYQMLGPTKQVMVYTLPHDERRRALEEGPVPFLFNMRMDQAKSRYRWRLLREEAPTKGTPGFYYVEIRPLHPIDMEEFSVAWVKLNQATLLPEALQLFAPNGGKDKRTYEFLDVERNGANNMANNPGNFDGEQMANEFAKFGYKIIINANPVPDEATPKLGARPSAAGEPPARNNRPFGRR